MNTFGPRCAFNFSSDIVSIKFDEQISYASFNGYVLNEVVSNGIQIELLLAGTVLATQDTAAVIPGQATYGFSAMGLFDEIRISDGPSLNGQCIVLDDLRYKTADIAPIPLPASGVLMLGALGMLGAAVRRRRARG